MKFVQTIWAFILKFSRPVLRFLGSLVEPSKRMQDATLRSKARLSASMALILMVFNLIGLVASFGLTDPSALYGLIVLTALLIVAYALSRTRRYRVGAGILVLALSLLAYLPIFTRPDLQPTEITNSIYAYIPISLIITSGILGLWEMLFFAVINMVAISSIPGFLSAYSFRQSGTDAGNIVTIGFLLLIVVAYRNSTERERLAETEEINRELKVANLEVNQARETLEARVIERTETLEQRTQELASRSDELEIANYANQRRATQFQAIAQVSRAIASIRNLDEILPEITRVISQHFGFYHAGIFLVDELKKYAVLRAANSEGGHRMLARGHRLEVGQVGIVGSVVASGAPRVALDTGADTVHFKNPDLPETHSEMALPLRVGNEVIGALDVQSTEPNAFTQEDVEVLATLADQVSIAIQNTRLFETTQKSLEDVEALYRQYIRKEWSQVSDKQKIAGYRYSILGTLPIEQADHVTMEQVASAGKTLLEQDESMSNLAVPIKLRGEIIGMLKVNASGNRTWNKDELDIIESVAERVAISAENARLFEQTSERAERERQVAEISAKIGASVNIRNVLQTTVEELARAIPGAEVLVQFQTVNEAQK